MLNSVRATSTRLWLWIPGSALTRRLGGTETEFMPRQITGRLVIATHNRGKLAEMRDLLARYGVEAVSAGELNLPEPEETGSTFAANARLKAEAAAQVAGMPAFADDSGLVVDAL